MAKLLIEVECAETKCDNCSELGTPGVFSREDRYFCNLFGVWVGRNAERCLACLAAEREAGKVAGRGE